MNQIAALFSLILNRRMLLCGVLFYLLAACLGNITDVLSHEGPYVVTYGEDGEIVREVDRVTFLRDKLTMYGGLTLFILGAWWFVSKYERDSALAKEAEIRYLEARVATMASFRREILGAIDPEESRIALKKALASPEYVSAAAHEETAMYEHRAKVRLLDDA